MLKCFIWYSEFEIYMSFKNHERLSHLTPAVFLNEALKLVAFNISYDIN